MQYLVELSIFVMIVAVIITQVLIPGFKGVPFFAAFRSKKVHEVEREVADALIELEIQRIQKRAESIRHSADVTEGEK